MNLQNAAQFAVTINIILQRCYRYIKLKISLGMKRRGEIFIKSYWQNFSTFSMAFTSEHVG